MTLARIISGFQTGVDQAAIDAAIDLGFPYGGAAPAGRTTEAGPLPGRYAVDRAEGDYKARTRANIQMATATLILTCRAPSGGTLYTLRETARAPRGYVVRVVRLRRPRAADEVEEFLLELESSECADVLNVAGPRLSKDPEAAPLARAAMLRALRSVLQLRALRLLVGRSI